MHKSAITKEFLGEQATPAPAAAAPTTTTQTTQPPVAPTQQNIKREFVIVKNGTSTGQASINTDVKAVITKLNDKNGVYYSVEFINTPSVDNLIYRPGQPFKTDSVVNADPTKFGITTTDRTELNGINTMMSKQIRTAAESL
jgi:ABC-type antimicrobial peptide transport system ATPase subunit